MTCIHYVYGGIYRIYVLCMYMSSTSNLFFAEFICFSSRCADKTHTTHTPSLQLIINPIPCSAASSINMEHVHVYVRMQCRGATPVFDQVHTHNTWTAFGWYYGGCALCAIVCPVCGICTVKGHWCTGTTGFEMPESIDMYLYIEMDIFFELISMHPRFYHVIVLNTQYLQT